MLCFLGKRHIGNKSHGTWEGRCDRDEASHQGGTKQVVDTGPGIVEALHWIACIQGS